MICDTCHWYAAFEGVCCNGDSEYCADWPPTELERCKYYDGKKESKSTQKASDSGGRESGL